MKELYLKSCDLRKACGQLCAGDKIYLSGCVYTARDAAHKRIFELMEREEKLPFEINDSVVYYAGPTPAPEHLPIGSCGPTTSSRMDRFAPSLYSMGMCATIGKGDRSQEVYDSIVKNKSVYLCAIGGAGALAAQAIKSCEVIAFDDLGCESIKKLEFDEFPLIVAIDCNGNSVFR